MKEQAKEQEKSAVAVALTSEDIAVEEKPVKPSETRTDPKQEVYHENAKVTCSCGNSFVVGSTKAEIHVEVCSNCHPFFTGQAKFVDTEGRVEAFQRRLSQKVDKKEKKTEEKSAPERPKSLKEMLQLIENS